MAQLGLEWFFRPVTLPVPPCPPHVQAISAIRPSWHREERPDTEGRGGRALFLYGFLILCLQGTAWAHRRGLGQSFRQSGVLLPPPASDHSVCLSVS